MRNKLFYGWYIVVAGMIFSAYNSSIFTYGYTAFINPILATFGWTMTQIALATSLRGLETGIFNPVWGAIVDKYDPKKLMFIGVTITSIGIFILSQTANLLMYYAGFLVIGLGASLCTGMIQTASISRWFKKDLGKATGIFYMGLGIGGVLVPVLVMIIDKFGWQTTLLFASIIFFVMGNSLAFVYKRRPEDMGLLKDGVKPSDTSAAESATRKTDEFGVTVKQAIRMRAFWHLNIVTVFQNSAMGTLNIFIIPYLTGLGLSRPFAGTVVSIFTLLSLFVRVPLGMMVDRFQKKYIVTMTLSLMSIGLIILWSMDGNSPFWIFLLFGIVYGLGLGGIMVLRPPILVEHFGTKNFGAIFGLSSIAITIAGVVSQPVAGLIFDSCQSYKPWWLALVVFSFVAITLMLTMPKPRRNMN
jgi:MFS transporter, OFA family, oxalate/formate antiporter